MLLRPHFQGVQRAGRSASPRSVRRYLVASGGPSRTSRSTSPAHAQFGEAAGEQH
ncbi:hypothetical protein [Frankia sp. AgB32]|uniref:hypothetical protein n=1 Tax=Frankia sp. AgB32 TaxID=631119 RepID=UPI00200C9FD2|nr:hypothetical protein [Frankia sp. AgB32]